MAGSTQRQALVYASVVVLASSLNACSGPAFEAASTPSEPGATGGTSSAGAAGANSGGGVIAPFTIGGAPSTGGVPSTAGISSTAGVPSTGGDPIAGAGGGVPTAPEGVALDDTNWQLSASNTYEPATSPKYVIDDDPYSCWASGTSQVPGMWFMVDLGEPQFFFELDAITGPMTDDYARHLRLSASLDGSNFTELRRGIEGTHELKIAFKQAKFARYLKLELEGDAGGLWWRIDDLSVQR